MPASGDPAAPAHPVIDRPRVLWVTNEPPDRSGGGGNIRQAYLLDAVAQAFTTDLLVVGRLRDDALRRDLRHVVELGVPRDVVPRGSVGRRLFTLAMTFAWREPWQAFPTVLSRRRLARALRHGVGADADLVLVEQEALAPLLSREHPGTWVLTFQHVLSMMAEQEVQKAPGSRQRWMWQVEARKARRFEEAAVRGWDAAIACSDSDAGYLRSLIAGSAEPDIAVVPNGVNLDRFTVTPVPATPTMLLPGTLAFAPNVDGAIWFCDHVLPRVIERVPAATLTIAGRDPIPPVTRLGERPGVRVLADLPSLVPLFEEARVVVVPLRVGTGTRLKALEGMAAARPVVGTSIGLEGLAVTNGVEVDIADDPAVFADAIVRLLEHDEIAHARAAAGRALVEERYGWERMGTTMVAWLEALLASRSARS